MAWLGMRHVHEIEVFLEAYRLRSFSAAAASMHATQSGVSQCIKRLESDIGVSLFRRSNNTIEPTEAGKRFYEHCSTFMLDHKALVSDLRTGPTRTRSLTVGVNAWMARYIVPSTIDKFSRQLPGVHLTVIEAASQTLVKLRQEGRVTVAVTSTQACDDSAFVSLKTPGILVGGAPLNLNANSRPINIIIPSPSDPNREIIDRYLEQNALPIARRMELDSLSAAFSLLRASDWMMILPEIVFLSEPDRSKLYPTALERPPIFRLSLLHAQGGPTEEARTFETILRGEISSCGANGLTAAA